MNQETNLGLLTKELELYALNLYKSFNDIKPTHQQKFHLNHKMLIC